MQDKNCTNMDKIKTTQESESSMTNSNLFSFIDQEALKLLAQYREWLRINTMLVSGQEQQDALEHRTPVSTHLFKDILKKNIATTNGKTGRSWKLFSSTHQKITKARHLELEGELEEVSNAMKFANPAIWMMYKGLAYLGTDKHNPTVQAFVDHTRYEQICGKRIAYVNRYIETNYYGDNLFSGTLLPLDMDTVEAARSEFIINLCQNDEFMRGWQAGEYNPNGKWV